MRHWFQRLVPGRRRKAQGARLVVAAGADRFAYVQARRGAQGRYAVEAAGVLLRGDASEEQFQRRVRELALDAGEVIAVLPPEHYQVLQIEAPAVPSDELRAAARWRIKDLVDAHIDDLTLDVLRVGDERHRPQAQLFVVAAASQRVAEATTRCQSLGLALSVVDIAETAQRNLQCALADTAGVQDDASAALVVHGGQCLFTVCAHGELFYTRRLPWDERTLAHAAAAAGPGDAPAAPAEQDGLIHFDEPGLMDDTPPVVIEVQRSLDVWERTWPALSVGLLYVDAGAHTEALLECMRAALVLPVRALDASAALAGADTLDAATRSAVLPLLGAALREEPRAL